MENALRRADAAEPDNGQDEGQGCAPTSTHPLYPEDIELARKRAELNLYLEKASALEREFLSLRASLAEFSARIARQTGMAGKAHVKAVGTGHAERYAAMAKAIREEANSEVMRALLGEVLPTNREISSAALSFVTGTTRSYCLNQPVDGRGGNIGAELIRVIRKIYAARERILFLHRAIMKLRFSALYRLMTEIHNTGDENIDTLRQRCQHDAGRD